MHWGEGDQWLLTLDLPAGAHEFKIVAAKAVGAAPAEWEAGPNRTLQARVWVAAGGRRAAAGGRQQAALHSHAAARTCSLRVWTPAAPSWLQVPAAEASKHGAFTVVCEWGRTQASLETLPAAELREALPGGAGVLGAPLSPTLLCWGGGRHCTAALARRPPACQPVPRRPLLPLQTPPTCRRRVERAGAAPRRPQG